MASISLVVSNCGGASQITLNQTIVVGESTAIPDVFTAYKNLPLNGNVSLNDSPCTVGATTYELTTLPTNGTLGSFDTNTGAFVYNPSTDYIGSDTFQYQISCGGIPQDTPVTVTITVIGATAVQDHTTLNANSPASFNVSANDTPCNEGGTTTYEITGNPTNGGVTGFDANTGVGTYTPNANYVGSDSLTYVIKCNGFIVGTSTHEFTVLCVPITQATITGNMTPIVGATEVYSVINQDGTPIYAYNWTVDGGTIMSGQGTSSITVLWI